MSTTTRSSKSLIRFAAVLLFIAAMAMPPPAEAQGRPLDAPRAAGTVGERFDGLAVVRDPNASSSIRALVDRTNAQRLSLYKQRAAEAGGSVKDIGMIYAQQIMKSAPAGTWFLDPSGNWTRR